MSIWLDVIEGVIFELRLAVRRDIERLVKMLRPQKEEKIYRNVKIRHDHDDVSYCAFCECSVSTMTVKDDDRHDMVFCDECGYELWREDL